MENYDGQLYEKSQNKWFDGYCNERIVLIDDFDHQGGNCLGHYLKRWADKWIVKAEVKGNTVQLKHEWFVITSNYSINDLFGPNGTENDADASAKRMLVKAL